MQIIQTELTKIQHLPDIHTCVGQSKINHIYIYKTSTEANPTMFYRESLMHSIIIYGIYRDCQFDHLMKMHSTLEWFQQSCQIHSSILNPMAGLLLPR